MENTLKIDLSDVVWVWDPDHKHCHKICQIILRD